MLTLRIWVGLYSQLYSHETLFTPFLFTENTIHNNIITENTDTIHNIHTIRRKLLPMKVREWKPILDAKYLMKRKYAAE